MVGNEFSQELHMDCCDKQRIINLNHKSKQLN